MRTPSFQPSMPLCLLSAALLAACGGGASDAVDAALSSDTATAYSANSTVISGDAGSALDTTLLTTQQLAALGASSAGREQPQAVSAGPIACPGGGSATLQINGGTLQSQLNGQLDAGEIYQLAYTDCKGALGQAALNGSVTMTVNSASSTAASVSLATSNLSVALPRGTVMYNGTATVQRSVVTAGSGSVVTTQFASPSLSVVTQFNARQSSFTLSGVDITRQAVFAGGILQSTSYNGTHTLSAVLPNASFSYTVATQGGVSYSANGAPLQGAWQITLPRSRITITIANGSATITIDEGKDGSIDRTFTVPVSRLETDAG